MKKITGLYTALVTPFEEDGGLDEAGLRHLIRRQIAAHVDGITVLGTTGESPALTAEERQRIILISREETLDKIQLMVGTGCCSTAQTIEQTRIAKSLGADSALIVCPYYIRPTQEGIYQHFATIAEAVALPIVVYNIPGRTGQNIHTDTLLRLAESRAICGVKDSSGSMMQIMDVIEKIGRDNAFFSILSGDDAMTIPVMSLGGHGLISVISNLVPDEVVQLIREAQAGDFAAARRSHFSLSSLMHAAFIETNPIPIKAMMNMRGLPSGYCRLPLSPLSPINEQNLRSVLNLLLCKSSHPPSF